MRWQNLLSGRCPRCGEKFVKAMDHAVIYECSGENGCQFVISEKRYLSMLADPHHPMRRHASPDDLVKLEALMTAAV